MNNNNNTLKIINKNKGSNTNHHRCRHESDNNSTLLVETLIVVYCVLFHKLFLKTCTYFKNIKNSNDSQPLTCNIITFNTQMCEI